MLCCILYFQKPVEIHPSISSNLVKITFWYLHSSNLGFRDFSTRILHCITSKYILFGYVLVFITFRTFLNGLHRFRVVRMYQISQGVLSHLLLFLTPSLGVSLSLFYKKVSHFRISLSEEKGLNITFQAFFSSGLPRD